MTAMTNDLQDLISKSSFKVEDGRYAYAKVKDAPASVNDHFMVSCDDDEITVVTREENVNDLNLIERNKESYALIALNVAVPFYSVGFLSTVSSAIAEEGMNVLIVSTYSKDYIMVKDDCLEKVTDILKALGFQPT